MKLFAGIESFADELSAIGQFMACAVRGRCLTHCPCLGHHRQEGPDSTCQAAQA